MLARSRRTLPLVAALLLAAAPTLQAQTPDSAAARAADRRPTLAVLNFHNGAFGNSAEYEALRRGSPTSSSPISPRTRGSGSSSATASRSCSASRTSARRRASTTPRRRASAARSARAT